MAGTPPPFARPASVASGVRRTALVRRRRAARDLLLRGDRASRARSRTALRPPGRHLQAHRDLPGRRGDGDGGRLDLLALCLRTLPGPGTLAWPFMSGLFLDWVLPRLPVIHGYGLRLFAVLAATLAMALGGACAFRAAIGVSAYDSIMLGLHRVTGRPLAPLRVAMELHRARGRLAPRGRGRRGHHHHRLFIGPAIQFWIRRLGGIPGTHAEPTHPATDLRHHPLAALEAVVEPPEVEAATYEAAGVATPSRSAPTRPLNSSQAGGPVAPDNGLQRQRRRPLQPACVGWWRRGRASPTGARRPALGPVPAGRPRWPAHPRPAG